MSKRVILCLGGHASPVHAAVMLSMMESHLCAERVANRQPRVCFLDQFDLIVATGSSAQAPLAMAYEISHPSPEECVDKIRAREELRKGKVPKSLNYYRELVGSGAFSRLDDRIPRLALPCVIQDETKQKSPAPHVLRNYDTNSTLPVDSCCGLVSSHEPGVLQKLSALESDISYAPPHKSDWIPEVVAMTEALALWPEETETMVVVSLIFDEHDPLAWKRAAGHAFPNDLGPLVAEMRHRDTQTPWFELYRICPAIPKYFGDPSEDTASDIIRSLYEIQLRDSQVFKQVVQLLVKNKKEK